MTGVLVLTAVTPVIHALFDPFELDPSHPGNGQAMIVDISDRTSASWSDVYDNLISLAVSLSVFQVGQDDINDVVQALAKHFDAANDPRLPLLLDSLRINETNHWAQTPDLQLLFGIAQILDDGHGLSACKVETGWHGSPPRLFEVGGHGAFIGTHVSYNAGSQKAVLLGESLEKALATGSYGDAGDLAFGHVKSLLDGFTSSEARQKVLFELIGFLSEESSKSA